MRWEEREGDQLFGGLEDLSTQFLKLISSSRAAMLRIFASERGKRSLAKSCSKSGGNL